MSTKMPRVPNQGICPTKQNTQPKYTKWAATPPKGKIQHLGPSQSQSGESEEKVKIFFLSKNHKGKYGSASPNQPKGATFLGGALGTREFLIFTFFAQKGKKINCRPASLIFSLIWLPRVPYQKRDPFFQTVFPPIYTDSIQTSKGHIFRLMAQNIANLTLLEASRRLIHHGRMKNHFSQDLVGEKWRNVFRHFNTGSISLNNQIGFDLFHRLFFPQGAELVVDAVKADLGEDFIRGINGSG